MSSKEQKYNPLKSSSRKAARLARIADPSLIVSDKTYNLVMGGVILYGLLVNVILCLTCGNFMSRVNPWLFLIAYFVLCIAGSVITFKSDNPAVSFLGYNMVVVPIGLLVANLVYAYAEINPTIVYIAIIDTTIITAMMIAASIVFPNFFSKLGTTLFFVLLGFVIVSGIMILVGVHTIVFSYIGAGIFCLYIGYDFWKAQQYQKTVDNAIDSALDIYLDIINLFIRILAILGNGKDN